MRFYQTLYENLYLRNPGSRFYHLLFVLRRSLLVLVIFTLSDRVWLQFIIFMAFCVLQFSYLTHTRPIVGKLALFIEQFNEFWCIVISYSFLSLVGQVHEAEQIHSIGVILIT